MASRSWCCRARGCEPFALGWLFLVACSPPASSPPPPPPTPSASAPTAAASSAPAAQPPRPTAPVVVAMVIDQFAAWVAHERLPLLPEGGGFARLRREGTWVVEARHPYAATDTAPGHATLHTGQPPERSGIFGNEVPEGTARVSILRDATTRLVGPRGKAELPGSSLQRLRAPTVADRLRGQHADAFIASVSIKDRGALFGCGHKPDGCLWFEPGLDAFVTSTAFAETLPPWALTEASAEATARARATPWRLTDDEQKWVAQHATTADEQKGEGDWWGLGGVFPHDAGASKKASSVFRASPAGDERVLALATAALAQQSLGQVPTLLSISLSSNDYVGHIFGPESWEAWDHLLRLDAALGAFFQKLDARFGADGYAVVLSADHGVTPLPETHGARGARPWCERSPDRWRRSCVAGGRLSMEKLSVTLEAAATKALGRGPWVSGMADPYVFLTPQGRALPPARRERLLGALRDAARREPCIERIVDARARPADCPPLTDESPEALICRSIPREFDGEFYVAPAVGCFFDADYVPGFGTSHGTPFLYDRAVPILARAPGRIAGGRVIDEPRPSATYTSTVTALLGLDLLDGAPAPLTR